MPSDRYQQLTALPPGRFIAKRLGLPESRPLFAETRHLGRGD